MLFESRKAAKGELSTGGPLRGGQTGEQLFGQNRNGLHTVHGGRKIVRGRGREEEGAARSICVSAIACR